MGKQTGQEDTDYKYVMQDAGTIYLGARFSYEEIMNHADITFKIKAIIEHYLTKEIALDTSLESHFYYMEAGSFSARTYEQLRVRIKVSERKLQKGLFGKEKLLYTDRIYKLQEFTALSVEEKKKRGMLIQEIAFPKMALMMFPV